MRITASRGLLASSRQATSVYFWSERRNSTASTGISWTLSPTDARSQRSGPLIGPFFKLAAICASKASVFDAGRGGLQPLSHARDGLGESRRFHGLHQVVEHALRERLRRRTRRTP